MAGMVGLHSRRNRVFDDRDANLDPPSAAVMRVLWGGVLLTGVLLGLGGFVVGVVFGIREIRYRVRHRKTGSPRPISQDARP